MYLNFFNGRGAVIDDINNGGAREFSFAAGNTLISYTLVNAICDLKISLKKLVVYQQMFSQQECY